MKGLKHPLLVLLMIISPSALTQTFQQYIQASDDDAEEKYDGSYVTTTSSDIELVYDTWNDQELQTIGLRFDNVTIPANSLITNAYIQFTADGSYSGNVVMNIWGEDVANSTAFANTINNISNRTTTSASVTWSSVPSWTDGQSSTNQRTPDLSSIVTEVISSNGWQNGNPISFIITGNGNSSIKRKAYSFDEDPLKSAKLVIAYSSLSDVDLAVTDIVTPSLFNYPNAAATLQVEILSYGNLPANSYSVSYEVDGNLMATEPGTTPLNLGQSTVFTFAQTTDLSTLGNYDISAYVTIANDEDNTNDALIQTIEVVEEVDTLFFNMGSSWRYWDNAANPGTAWYTTGFADDTWPVGMGHQGFGEGDEQTVLDAGNISYYFRKEVDVSNAALLDEVYMHMIHDDAAIVYINGQEAFRTELMPLGTISHTTAARQSSNSTNENYYYSYKVDTALFVSGINTIAISVRNRSASNGDLSFNCFMTSGFSYDYDGPYVSYDGSDIIVEEVTPNGLVTNTYTSAAGLQLTCQLPHMGTSFSFELKSQITTEPSEYNYTPPKFLTISDFDGHIQALTMILQGEGIIDNNFEWTYGDGHLIISGDLFDRGFHITECMWLLYKLESEAEAQGGKVHLIIGNHEMMNMTDDWRYVERKYFNSAHLMGKRMIELYDADTELGRWLRSKNIMERIGDYAFVHGGLSPQLAALDLTYDEINDYGRMEMNGTCVSGDCQTVTGSDGVYWYRGMAEEDLTQQDVDSIVLGFGVERVIMGHTKDHTARALYQGRVLAIDMYHMDNYAQGYMEALQFELGCFHIFHTDQTGNTYTLLDTCDNYTNILDINGDDQLQIFPNPTTEFLNIKLSDNLMDQYDYKVVDVAGKMITSGKVEFELTRIALDDFTKGTYFLILQNSQRTISGKFILK
jgi:hypothetical protein